MIPILAFRAFRNQGGQEKKKIPLVEELEAVHYESSLGRAEGERRVMRGNRRRRSATQIE
jgi:hypothetical protein